MMRLASRIRLDIVVMMIQFHSFLGMYKYNRGFSWESWLLAHLYVAGYWIVSVPLPLLHF